MQDKTPEFTIEGLALQPVTQPDVAALHRLFLDEHVRRYLLDDQRMSREWVETVVADSERQFATGGTGLWTISPAAGQEPRTVCGVVGLREFFDPPRMQLIFAVQPEYWGRGIARRASQKVLEYLFGTLQWTRVEAATDGPNLASIRLLERLGFVGFEPEEKALCDDGTLFFELFTETSTS